MEPKREIEISEMKIAKISEINIFQLFRILMKKKLLLIRPRVQGDAYTELGSYDWAGLVKQKALDLGWEVTDLAINNATRENVEKKINEIKPNLIIHYDHGSFFTLWGQEAGALEAAIDNLNVELIANRITSTVSCDSAAGLGPMAITNGAISYLGYDQPHAFVIGYQDLFGEASNAANYALLECKTIEEAYQIGIDAYNDLYDNLMAQGDVFAANWALHDRDCFVLLGSGDVTACPKILLCRPGLPDSRIHCRPGLPDLQFHCMPGLPDLLIRCKPGLPNMQIHCRLGLPDRPLDIECKIGAPMSYLVERCPEGPIIELDLERIPNKFKKSITQLLNQIKMEE
ncbi:MAG: hypothetical protein ACFE9L_16335 [Candidatus Hodarchaeota archaeon]